MLFSLLNERERERKNRRLPFYRRLFSSGYLLFVYLFDIEANSTAPDSEEAEWKGRGGESRSGTSKASESGMAVANTGKVKFDPPSVPVIFVLGKKKYIKR